MKYSYNITIDVRLIDSGGVGVYIVEHLWALINDGRFNLTLLGNKELIESYGFFENSNIKIVDFQFKIFSIKEQLNFLKIINKTTDLFWSPQYNLPFFTTNKVVVTIHDLLHLKFKQNNFGFFKKYVSYFYFLICSLKPKLIIFNSNFTKNEFFSMFKHNSFIVTHLGVNQIKFKNLHLPKNEIDFDFYIMIGNVKPHKNFEFAIRGFLKYSKTNDCKLVIIGRHENFITSSSSTLELIAKNSDKIIFLGKVSDTVLVNYLKNSRGLIFPSSYEGFGLPALEAMSLGVPIIASKIPSTVEVCGNKLPYYFDLNNFEQFVQQLNVVFSLSDKELSTLIFDMKKHSENYTWNKCTSSTINSFVKVLNEK
jgi:glycosyltransferase involved in cell wall biosynthesis